MHQIFYIDIEEEISSIIDRLYKSMSGDNYFVIPKRAVFLQSIINLKLLKREAGKIGKRAVIITQDEIGTSMAKRCGIDVLANLEGLEQDPEEALRSNENEDLEYEEEGYKDQEAIIRKEYNKQNRLKNIGSEDFYNSSEHVQNAKNFSKIERTSLGRNMPISSGSVSDNNIGEEMRKEYLRNENPRTKVYKTINTRQKGNDGFSSNYSNDILKRDSMSKKGLDPYKEKTLEKMFSRSQANFINKEGDKKIKEKNVIVKKIFLGFAAVCLLVLIAVAGYLFVPSAKITIIPNVSKNKVDVKIVSDNSAGENETGIPMRVIDKEESLSLSYDISNKNLAAGQKARGTVVIYNEYSSAGQPLIATTRLETSDGKIFRLVRGITVPGTTSVGGEIKPGAIETDVIADQAGSEFNIDPSKFTVPGFKDGPKFEKFYAKSSSPMKGGTSGGAAELLDKNEGGESTIISQKDIDNAKEKTESALREKISQSIKNDLREGEVALPEAERIIITKSSASAKIGSKINSFDYSVSASVRVIVFSESDVENVIENSFKNRWQMDNISKETSKIEYGIIEPDFDKSVLKLTAYEEIKTIPVINQDQIKKEMLGKNADQLEDVLKKYQSIKNLNVEFQPEFISRVPQYGKRVEVEIKNED